MRVACDVGGFHLLECEKGVRILKCLGKVVVFVFQSMSLYANWFCCVLLVRPALNF